MPGDAIAREAVRSYLGPLNCVQACFTITLQTVVIQTAAGHDYATQYQNGAWRSNWIQTTS